MSFTIRKVVMSKHYLQIKSEEWD